MTLSDALPTHMETFLGEKSVDEQAPTPRPDKMTLACALTGIVATIGYYDRFWIFSSVQVFIGVAMFMVLWVCSTWTKLLIARHYGYSKIDGRSTDTSRFYKVALRIATGLVIWWAAISVFSGYDSDLPALRGNGDKYFIAINLYNNKAILDQFTRELTFLAQYSEPEHAFRNVSLTKTVGLDSVYISIYESNSDDGTGVYLANYRESLEEMGIPNQVIPMGRDEGARFPYGTSPERISFLAKMRNKAMESIQSADPEIRLPNWHEFTKVVFLNDIYFDWEDIVRLIATRVEGKEDEDYDVVCAMDFGEYGESWRQLGGHC
jgi:hypothetical protein